MELESIKRIATQLDKPNVSEVLESRLKQLSCEQTRVTIAGGANVGKTTLINALANTDLEVSSIPTSMTVRITYEGKGDSESVKTNSEWLHEKNIEIWELSDAELGNEPTLGEFGLHFIHSDVCIMLLNSMSALSRTEISQLEVLEQLGIPTLLVLSKADQVNGNDYLEVEKYVEQSALPTRHDGRALDLTVDIIVLVRQLRYLFFQRRVRLLPFDTSRTEVARRVVEVLLDVHAVYLIRLTHRVPKQECVMVAYVA